MTSSQTRVDVLPVVESTNAEGMHRVAAGEQGPLWIRADRQTGGKGRSGRTWASAPGNLYASLVTRLEAPLGALPQLSLVAGVAVVDAIDAVVGGPVPGLRLKWPNDVLIDGAKLAGILPETTTMGGVTMAVIGVGINLAHHPDGLGRAATHLGAHTATPISPEQMLGVLDTALARWLTVWQSEGGFSAVRAGWCARAGSAGEILTVTDKFGPKSGTFAGLDGDGALIMRLENGALHRVTYGDVTLGTGDRRG